VNGQSVGALSSYTFSDVQANQTIHAEFAQITYTITATAGAGGSISPSGVVTVPYMGSQTFTITPNSGYVVAAVLVNGVSVGAVSSYTFSQVVFNQQIHAVFTPATYVVTAIAGNGGTISPSGTFIVNHGSSITFTIAPNPGYQIDSILVNEVNVGPVNIYQLTQINANTTISAWFSLITSGAEIGQQSELSIFPNPSKGIITVSGKGTIPAEWLIADAAGRIVQTGFHPGQQEMKITVNLKPGIYSLTMIDKSGKKHTTKLIVQ
ncbi:MAG TPA: T9SS type A sorting domain-containing protein, partial [Bacteroidales bacterium]|nr:T9SS type A sorting domain-containing protein [Bacteroidales bacterium]